MKLISSRSEGVVEAEDDDIVLDIPAGIGSALYLDLGHDMYRKQDGSGGYAFKDGLDSIDGRSDDGQFIREINEAFYNERPPCLNEYTFRMKARRC